MGTSIPTLTRWESGEVASIGRTVPQRRQLAERIIESTGCPSSWFGLSEPSEAVEAELRRLIDELASQVTELQLDLATVQTDLADARKHQGLAEHVPEATGG